MISFLIKVENLNQDFLLLFFCPLFNQIFAKDCILVSSRRKKDSVASIIIDTKDSLNTPLIIKTQSIESLSETDETTSRPRSVTPTIKYR